MGDSKNSSTHRPGMDASVQVPAVSASKDHLVRLGNGSGRPPLAERQAQGRGLRATVPRSAHAAWTPPPDRPDPVALLESQAAQRLPELIPLRYARMRSSPFAFLRGAAIVMARDLAHLPATGIQTQLCGDAHLANFGLYASPERMLVFDLNDFDETLPGPCEWDLKRLAASCHVAGRSNGFTESDCRAATLASVRSYRQHMAEYATMRELDVWYAHIRADDLLALIRSRPTQKKAQVGIVKAQQRVSLQALPKLTEVVNSRRLIVDDPPLVMRVAADFAEGVLDDLFARYRQTTRGAQRRLLERFQVMDVARKVVGIGSVGTRCFILLLAGRDDDDPLFLQIKEAQPSVLEQHLAKSEFEHQGERVVAGQELMQAASDIFLGWLRGSDGRDYYVRQLRDMKGTAHVETLLPSELTLWASACGWALARAHARAGDPVAIAAYLGANGTFDRAIADFAGAYANQTEHDYQTFLSAIASGRIAAAPA